MNLYRRLNGITPYEELDNLEPVEANAILAGYLGEGLEKIEQGGEDVEEEGINQSQKDLLFGILRDWACLAAGLPAPWTWHPQTSLGKLLSRKVEKTRKGPVSSFARSHNTRNRPGESQGAEHSG